MRIKKVGKAIHPITGEVGSSYEVCVTEGELVSFEESTEVPTGVVIPLGVLKGLVERKLLTSQDFQSIKAKIIKQEKKKSRQD